MNIAIIGYGKMAHEIEKAAKAKGFTIKSIIDPEAEGVTHKEISKESLEGVDVAVDFTHPSSAVENIKKAKSNRTRAIIVPHMFGLPADIELIISLGIPVIEDCAHAIETEYHSRKAGTFGDLGCFSFYVNKNIVTGEGGMAITDNEEYANQIKILGLHGMSKDSAKSRLFGRSVSYLFL